MMSSVLKKADKLNLSLSLYSLKMERINWMCMGTCCGDNLETCPLCYDVSVYGFWTKSCNFNQFHDDVIKWKHFRCCWPFLRGIHQSPVNSPNKCQWRGALMFSLIYPNSSLAYFGILPCITCIILLRMLGTKTNACLDGANASTLIISSPMIFTKTIGECLSN